VPLTLVLPRARFVVGVWGMVGLHIGIALSMSLNVGLVFLTTLPTYIAGFSCGARVGSAEWLLAAAVALLPSALVLLRGRQLAEDWPSTPCSLFMWNGEQAERLARLTMTGKTRLVLATREVAQSGALVGMSVVHHGGSGAFGTRAAPGEQLVVHDSILRVAGFTLLHDDLIDAFDLPTIGRLTSTQADAGREAAELLMMRRLLRRLEVWLGRERRVLETASGRPLLHAYFVSIDGDNRVASLVAMAAA